MDTLDEILVRCPLMLVVFLVSGCAGKTNIDSVQIIPTSFTDDSFSQNEFIVESTIPLSSSYSLSDNFLVNGIDTKTANIYRIKMKRTDDAWFDSLDSEYGYSNALDTYSVIERPDRERLSDYFFFNLSDLTTEAERMEAVDSISLDGIEDFKIDNYGLARHISYNLTSIPEDSVIWDYIPYENLQMEHYIYTPVLDGILVDYEFESHVFTAFEKEGLFGPTVDGGSFGDFHTYWSDSDIIEIVPLEFLITDEISVNNQIVPYNEAMISIPDCLNKDNESFPFTNAYVYFMELVYFPVYEWDMDNKCYVTDDEGYQQGYLIPVWKFHYLRLEALNQGTASCYIDALTGTPLFSENINAGDDRLSTFDGHG